MNPVLLKPQSEVGAQVVVQGRVIGTARADAYQAMKPQFMPAVMRKLRGRCAAQPTSCWSRARARHRK